MRVHWTPWGAWIAGLMVALGAFGAHGLEQRVEEGLLAPERLETWRTAVFYGALHALALVQVGLLGRTGIGADAAGWCFLAGIVGFSGSLFAWVLGGPHGLVFVTPLGGVLFLVGWVALGVAAARKGTALRPNDG